MLFFSLPFLNKEAGDKLEMKGDEWNHLINYRNNLLGNQEGEGMIKTKY
jgi:hypothetical protein